MFCTECGAAVSDGARFCPSCGATTPGTVPQRVRPAAVTLLAVLKIVTSLFWLLLAGIWTIAWQTAPEGGPVAGAFTVIALTLAVLTGWCAYGLWTLVILNSARFTSNPEETPIMFRPPVDPLARQFVYFFAISPALRGSLIAGLFNLDSVVGGAGVALLMSGLAVIVATGDLIHLRRQRVLRSVWAIAIAAPAFVAIATTLLLPWTSSAEVPTSLPAVAIAHFFGDSFERRTNQRLRAVTGDPQLASFIAMDTGRPHLLLDVTPERTPWLTTAKFNETGGVVVWRASDTSGTPPPDIAKRFPGLVPEVPRAFDWIVNGRQPLLRIGWAIVRPKAQ